MLQHIVHIGSGLELFQRILVFKDLADIAQQVEMVARLSEANNLTARETEAVARELDRLSAALREAVSQFHV